MSAAPAFDMLIAIWSLCEPEDREAFVSYLHLVGFTESNQATGMGGEDVDRSAPRASSAVQLGATNSPERAHRSMSMTPIEPREANGLKGFGFTVTFDEPNSAPVTPEVAEQTGAVPVIPAAPAAPFNNPRCQHADTCHFAKERDCCHDCLMAWSKRPKDEQVRLWAEANEAARAVA